MTRYGRRALRSALSAVHEQAHPFLTQRPRVALVNQPTCRQLERSRRMCHTSAKENSMPRASRQVPVITRDTGHRHSPSLRLLMSSLDGGLRKLALSDSRIGSCL